MFFLKKMIKSYDNSFKFKKIITFARCNDNSKCRLYVINFL